MAFVKVRYLSIHQSIHVIICPVTHYRRRGLWHVMFSYQCDKMCSNICASDSSANKRDTQRVIRIVMNDIRAIKNNETAQWLKWSAPVMSLNFIILLFVHRMLTVLLKAWWIHWMINNWCGFDPLCLMTMSVMLCYN